MTGAATLATRLLCAVLALALVGGCTSSTQPNNNGGGGPNGGGGNGTGGAPPDTRPIAGLAAEFTYSLSQSTDSVRLWTTPPCAKVYPETSKSPIPENRSDSIHVYAAGGETEPIQLAVWAEQSGDCYLATPTFGIGETVRLYSVENVLVTTPSDGEGQAGRTPDPLLPRASGDVVTLTGGENGAFWISLEIPPDAPPGDYTGVLGVHAGGRLASLPVVLHVFGFHLPRELHTLSLVSPGPAASGSTAGTLASMNAFLYAHRLTPAHPAGDKAPRYVCSTGLVDDYPGDPAGFAALGPQYVLGQGWNEGAGFPAFELLAPADSLHPRPALLCDIPLGEAYGTPEYNLRWQGQLAALDAYVVAHGYAPKAYYMVAEAPSVAADPNLAAYLAETARAAAPHLELAVASVPRVDLYANGTYRAAGFDIWLAGIRDLATAQAVVADRQGAHGERAVWDATNGEAPPYPNPLALDHPSMEPRLVGFLLFSSRLDGWSSSVVDQWDPNPWTQPGSAGWNGARFLFYPDPQAGAGTGRLIPSIRLELLRDGLEDYEYLWLANGGRKPAPGGASQVDATVASVVQGLTDWTHDAEGFAALRRELGRYLAGERATLPVLVPGGSFPRPRGAYGVNFQDPTGEPLANPLEWQGRQYEKAGWKPYDPAVGYGWLGDLSSAPGLRAEWLATPTSASPLERSIVYDADGTARTFEFDLENGAYDVTVSVGWPSRASYKHQRVIAEGVPIVNDEGSSNPTDLFILKRTARVEIRDGKLTLEVGGVTVGGQPELTILDYLTIDPAG